VLPCSCVCVGLISESPRNQVNQMLHLRLKEAYVQKASTARFVTQYWGYARHDETFPFLSLRNTGGILCHFVSFHPIVLSFFFESRRRAFPKNLFGTSIGAIEAILSNFFLFKIFFRPRMQGSG